MTRRWSRLDLFLKSKKSLRKLLRLDLRSLRLDLRNLSQNLRNLSRDLRYLETPEKDFHFDNFSFLRVESLTEKVLRKSVLNFRRKSVSKL